MGHGKARLIFRRCLREKVVPLGSARLRRYNENLIDQPLGLREDTVLYLERKKEEREREKEIRKYRSVIEGNEEESEKEEEDDTEDEVKVTGKLVLYSVNKDGSKEVLGFENGKHHLPGEEGVIDLPGGEVQGDETQRQATVRRLQEEIEGPENYCWKEGVHEGAQITATLGGTKYRIRIFAKEADSDMRSEIENRWELKQGRLTNLRFYTGEQLARSWAKGGPEKDEYLTGVLKWLTPILGGGEDPILGKREDPNLTPNEINAVDKERLARYKALKEAFEGTVRMERTHLDIADEIQANRKTKRLRRRMRPAVISEINQVVDDLARAAVQHNIGKQTRAVGIDKLAKAIRVAINRRCLTCAGFHAGECPNLQRPLNQAKDLMTTGITCPICQGSGHTRRDHFKSADRQGEEREGEEDEGEEQEIGEGDEREDEEEEPTQVCLVEALRLPDDYARGVSNDTHCVTNIDQVEAAVTTRTVSGSAQSTKTRIDKSPEGIKATSNPTQKPPMEVSSGFKPPTEVKPTDDKLKPLIEVNSNKTGAIPVHQVTIGDGSCNRIFATLGPKNSRPLSIGIDSCAGINCLSEAYARERGLRIVTGRRRAILGVGARVREYSNYATATIKVGGRESEPITFLLLDTPGVCLISFSISIDVLGSTPGTDPDTGLPGRKTVILKRMGGLEVPIQQKHEKPVQHIQLVEEEKGKRFLVANEDIEFPAGEVATVRTRITGTDGKRDGWVANIVDTAFAAVEGPYIHPRSSGFQCMVIARPTEKCVSISEGDIIAEVRDVESRDLDALDVCMVSDDYRTNLNSKGHFDHFVNAHATAKALKGLETQTEVSGVLEIFSKTFRNIEKREFSEGETEISGVSYKKKAFRAQQSLETLRQAIAKDREINAKIFTRTDESAYIDQNGAEHKAAVREFFEKGFKKAPAHPELTSEVLGQAVQMAVKHSARWWTEGCRPPTIKGLDIEYQVEEHSEELRQQPFSESEYDKLRTAYYFEKESALQKWKKIKTLDERASLIGISPAFCIDQDGKGPLGRVVVDYRIVNKYTRSIPYPSPNAAAGLFFAQQQKFLTTGDLCWGFTQMLLGEKTSRLLAATTATGIFMPLRLPFGPKNGPASMQVLTDQLAHEAQRGRAKKDREQKNREQRDGGDETGDGSKREGQDEEDDPALRAAAASIVSFFVDDGTIGGQTPGENIDNVDVVLDAMAQYGAQFKLSKTQLLTTSVILLGFLIKDGKRYVHPGKTKTTRNWTVSDIPGIVSFLAFANFLREFVPTLAERAKPLREFIKNYESLNTFKENWEAATEAREAFEKLKDEIDTGMGLSIPDPESEFHLFVDASAKAWGATLVQFPEGQKDPRVISSTSGTWKASELVYDIREKEMLSAVRGLENFSSIIGTTHTFVYTDHKNNLSTFKVKRRSHQRLIRVALELQQYNATLCFLKGGLNVLGDVPSRLSVKAVKDVRLPAVSVTQMLQAFMKPAEWWELVEKSPSKWLIGPREPSLGVEFTDTFAMEKEDSTPKDCESVNAVGLEREEEELTVEDCITLNAIDLAVELYDSEKDPKLPKSWKEIPTGITRVEDKAGDNIVVRYQTKHKRKDGASRKDVWYKLRVGRDGEALKRALHHFRRHDKGTKNTREMCNLLEKADRFEEKHKTLYGNDKEEDEESDESENEEDIEDELHIEPPARGLERVRQEDLNPDQEQIKQDNPDKPEEKRQPATESNEKEAGEPVEEHGNNEGGKGDKKAKSSNVRFGPQEVKTYKVDKIRPGVYSESHLKKGPKRKEGEPNWLARLKKAEPPDEEIPPEDNSDNNEARRKAKWGKKEWDSGKWKPEVKKKIRQIREGKYSMIPGRWQVRKRDYNVTSHDGRTREYTARKMIRGPGKGEVWWARGLDKWAHQYYFPTAIIQESKIQNHNDLLKAILLIEKTLRASKKVLIVGEPDGICAIVNLLYLGEVDHYRDKVEFPEKGWVCELANWIEEYGEKVWSGEGDQPTEPRWTEVTKEDRWRVEVRKSDDPTSMDNFGFERKEEGPRKKPEPKLPTGIERARLARVINRLDAKITKLGWFPGEGVVMPHKPEVMAVVSEYLAKARIEATSVYLTKSKCEITVPPGTITAKTLLLTDRLPVSVEFKQPLNPAEKIVVGSDEPTLTVFTLHPNQLSDNEWDWITNVLHLSNPVQQEAANEVPFVLDGSPERRMFPGIQLQVEEEIWRDDYIAQVYCLLKSGGTAEYGLEYLKVKTYKLWWEKGKRLAPIDWKMALNRTRDFIIENDRLYYLERTGHETLKRLYVSEGEAKEEVFQKVKFSLTRRQAVLIESHRRTSHGGAEVMGQDMAGVWWPRIAPNIRDLVKVCVVCDYLKTRRKTTTSKKTHFRSGVFSEITIDSCGPYRIKKATGEIESKYIVVFLCEFSQFIWLRLTVKNDAVTIARELVFGVIMGLVGGGITIRTDRGSEYNNTLLNAVNNLLNNTTHFSNAFNPCSLSRNEHSHKYILRYLRTGAPLNESMVRSIEFAHRTTPKQQLGWKTPMEIITGRNPCLDFLTKSGKRTEDYGEKNNRILDLVLESLVQTRKEVDAFRRAESLKRRECDNCGLGLTKLIVGSLVLLDRPPDGPMVRKKRDQENTFKVKKENEIYRILSTTGSQITIESLHRSNSIQKVSHKRLTPIVNTQFVAHAGLPVPALLVQRGRELEGMVTHLGPGTLVKFEEEGSGHLRTVDTAVDNFRFHD